MKDVPTNVLVEEFVLDMGLQSTFAVMKICSHDGCTNKAANGGVCVRHGAKSYNKMCSHKGCTQYSRSGSGGVCVKHGAKIKVKSCSHEGCTNQVVSNNVCVRHGGKKRKKKKKKQNDVCTRHESKQKVINIANMKGEPTTLIEGFV